MGTKCHYILGNHEDFICKAQTDRETYSLWVHYNGGIKTITDFENHNDTVFDYIPWLKENTELYYETDDYIVCHGGCRRDVHTDLEDDIVWDRTCIEQGWYGGKLLIVGHTPLTFPLFAGVLNDNYEQHRLKYNEKETYNLKDFPTGCIDIDTGCTFGYWLTAMIIENGEFSLYKVKHHNPAPDADDGIDDDTEVLYE